MSRTCQISGKKPSVGNRRSKALNATKRKFLPNLIKKRIIDPKTGRIRKMKIAASTLRTITKKGKC